MSTHRGPSRPLAARPFPHRSRPKHRQAGRQRGRRLLTASALVVAGALSVGLTSDSLGVGQVQQLAGANTTALTRQALADLKDRGISRASRSESREALDNERQRIREVRTEARVQRERREAKARAEARREARLEARRAAEAARAWRAPLTGYRVSSPFGEYSYVRSGMHTGLDLSAPEGTPVTSVAAGTVVSAAYDGSFGNKVVVRHVDGTESWYCHLSTIDVSAGQAVANTTQVGRVGSTGNVTGPHLHLEIHPGGGDPVDPMAALAARGVVL